MEENRKIEDLLSNSCGCRLADHNKPCSKSLSFSYINKCRCEALELDKSELDLVILSCIRMSICNSSLNSKFNERQNSYSIFYVDGKRICLKIFLFLHGIHRTRYYALVKHYNQICLTMREHGNKRKRPHNAFSFEDVNYFQSFMSNYADDRAIILPGRYPGHKNINLRLLSSDTTKMNVWEFYADCCRLSEKPCMSYAKFVPGVTFSIFNNSPYFIFVYFVIWFLY